MIKQGIWELQQKVEIILDLLEVSVADKKKISEMFSSLKSNEKKELVNEKMKRLYNNLIEIIQQKSSENKNEYLKFIDFFVKTCLRNIEEQNFDHKEFSHIAVLRDPPETLAEREKSAKIQSILKNIAEDPNASPQLLLEILKFGVVDASILRCIAENPKANEIVLEAILDQKYHNLINADILKSIVSHNKVNETILNKTFEAAKEWGKKKINPNKIITEMDEILNKKRLEANDIFNKEIFPLLNPKNGSILPGDIVGTIIENKIPPVFVKDKESKKFIEFTKEKMLEKANKLIEKVRIKQLFDPKKWTLEKTRTVGKELPPITRQRSPKE